MKIFLATWIYEENQQIALGLKKHTVIYVIKRKTVRNRLMDYGLVKLVK